MTLTKVLKLIDKKRAGRTWVDIASEIPVNQPYLCDVMHGSRTPSKVILDWVNVQKITKYEYKRARGGSK